MANALIGKALALPASELEFEFGLQVGRRGLRAVAQRLACAVAACAGLSSGISGAGPRFSLSGLSGWSAALAVNPFGFYRHWLGWIF
ncbi:MAG: hypothetical protein EBQ71_15570 [Betaproteobacteria bacterium]|nr:hypothetical protein [Betaproteobacteria bacterium]